MPVAPIHPARSRSPLRAAALALAFALGALAAPGRAEAAGLAGDGRVAAATSLLDLWLREQLEAGTFPGLSIAVVHDQELVWSAGYGWADLASRRPATPATLYRIGSVTKLFTTTAVLQLRDQGRLALDDPVATHLPEFRVRNPFPDSHPVTLRHLLTQTSGLPREGPFPYWTTHVFPSREELLASLAGLTLFQRPGENYKYSNLGMALAGLVVERASGLSYADYLEQRVFAPLGMTRSTAAPTAAHHRERATSYFRRDASGNRRTFDYYDLEGLRAAGNVVSSVEDLSRFASLQLHDGPAGGTQILSGATLREMQRAHFVDAGFASGRGLGFAVRRDDGTTIVSHGGWIGGNRTHFLLDPQAKVAVVVAVNADDAEPAAVARVAHDLMAPAIAAAVAAPRPERGPDPAWRPYLGTYTDPWGWEYQVLVLDGELAIYEHAYPPEDDPRDGLTLLEPDGPGSFRLPDGEPVVFELGAAGEVVRMRRRFEVLAPVDGARPSAALARPHRSTRATRHEPTARSGAALRPMGR